jgi:hypothetical protein
MAMAYGCRGHCHIKRLEPSWTLIKTGLSERAYTLNVNLVYRCQVKKMLVGKRARVAR